MFVDGYGSKTTANASDVLVKGNEYSVLLKAGDGYRNPSWTIAGSSKNSRRDGFICTADTTINGEAR